MTDPAPSEPQGISDAARDHEARNTATLVAHLIVQRTGWVFKTESVIIPAFLDSIAGAGWLRGLLPIANRLGQSLPPFVLAGRIARLPRKKWVLLFATLGMASVFLSLALALHTWGGGRRPGYAAGFLVLYTLFFAVTGVGVQTLGTLTGKLITVDRRGRFLALSTAGSVIPAVGMVAWLLPGWLELGDAGWAAIFAFTGACFVVAGLLVSLLREPADGASPAPSAASLGIFRQGWQTLRDDANYRRLVIVNVLFTTSIILLPHYQALARDRLDLAGGSLMIWIALQNIAVGVASLVMGPLADRYGNRLSLRLVVFGSAAIPPFAIALTLLDAETGRRWFNAVFVGIGLTPIAFRLVSNYILEIAPPDEHPRYLALAPLCATAVMLSSPLFGAGIDLVGYEWVFGAVTLLVLAGGAMTFRLEEPRRRRDRR